MADRQTIIAVDFDGCLCQNAWPEIGEAREDVISALLERQKKGAKVILWTCRVGEHLAAAVQWCAEHGISFDAVNANLPANIAAYGNDCRKIYADEYWDDKACNPEIVDVSIPSGRVDNPPMLHVYRDDETARRISEERTTSMRSAQPASYAHEYKDGAVYDVDESDIAGVAYLPGADKKAEGLLSPFFVMFNEDNTISLKKPNSQDEFRLTNDTVRVLASILNDRIRSL